MELEMRTEMKKTEECCVFCGHTERLQPPHRDVHLTDVHRNPTVCHICNTTLQHRNTVEWFRWMKRNRPDHWQRIVDHHRLGRTPLARQVRNIRVEP